MTLGIMLALTFEIGQAVTLFSILTSKKERTKVLPWVLMFILTCVQILGNVFSSYRYLITNSAAQLRFFKEPIFVWTELPNDKCNVILTYIIGAILPIVALCLTAMLTNYLKENPKHPAIEASHEQAEPQVVEKIVEVPVEKIVEKTVEVPVEKIVEVPVEKIVEKTVEVPVEKIVEVPVEKIVEVPAQAAQNDIDDSAEAKNEESEEPVEEPVEESHFINM